jgi:hypothetical protein
MNRFTTVCLLAMITPLNAEAQTAGSYDGDYAGVGTLAAATGSNHQGDACAQTQQFTVHVRNGQVSMTRRVRAETVTVAGSVGGDGSISALGASGYGGVNLQAKINGGDLTGSSASTSCTYAFTLHRQ